MRRVVELASCDHGKEVIEFLDYRIELGTGCGFVAMSCKFVITIVGSMD